MPTLSRCCCGGDIPCNATIVVDVSFCEMFDAAGAEAYTDLTATINGPTGPYTVSFTKASPHATQIVTSSGIYAITASGTHRGHTVCSSTAIVQADCALTVHAPVAVRSQVVDVPASFAWCNAAFAPAAGESVSIKWGFSLASPLTDYSHTFSYSTGNTTDVITGVIAPCTSTLPISGFLTYAALQDAEWQCFDQTSSPILIDCPGGQQAVFTFPLTRPDYTGVPLANGHAKPIAYPLLYQDSRSSAYLYPLWLGDPFPDGNATPADAGCSPHYANPIDPCGIYNWWVGGYTTTVPHWLTFDGSCTWPFGWWNCLLNTDETPPSEIGLVLHDNGAHDEPVTVLVGFLANSLPSGAPACNAGGDGGGLDGGGLGGGPPSLPWMVVALYMRGKFIWQWRNCEGMPVNPGDPWPAVTKACGFGYVRFSQQGVPAIYSDPAAVCVNQIVAASWAGSVTVNRCGRVSASGSHKCVAYVGCAIDVLPGDTDPCGDFFGDWTIS